MIRTGLFDQNHLASLKSAVQAYAQRHEVTAQNIANVETAGYKAQKVKFEELLAGSGPHIEGYRTDGDHLAIGRRSPLDVRPESAARNNGYDNGVNDVNIDQEMADLATNDLSYRLATRLLSMRYGMLQTAITGRVR
ncbi:MAG TPA: flagellar basal body rod protein FlgB [Candidatus Krumholzibacteria bacterium]|nr:flagellar basal body rod protein FlgB [Candidatus Krumholzibacteria bacterium]